MYQDARVWAGLFDGAERCKQHLAPERYAYVHVARGEITIIGNRLATGDGARIRNEGLITFEQGKEAEVLLFDLRANEVPNL